MPDIPSTIIPPPTRQNNEDLNSPVNILVEIIGAYGIQSGATSKKRSDTSLDGIPQSPDKKAGLNPYVLVKQLGKKLHKTDVIEHSHCPVWTIPSKSLFIFKTTKKDLMREKAAVGTAPQEDSLVFHLLSKENVIYGVTTDIYLGRVTIDISSLLDLSDENRREFELKGAPRSSGGGTTTMALRFRIATESDILFIRKLQFSKKFGVSSFLGDNHADAGVHAPTNTTTTNDADDDTSSSTNNNNNNNNNESKKPVKRIKLHTDKDEIKVAGRNILNSFKSTAYSLRSLPRKLISAGSAPRYLIQPGPDPRRPKETVHMTRLQIEHETSLPSHNWIEAGSGTMGKLHLEVLSCHDLPNLDAGEAMGNYTDAFVCAVYEDAAVETCVIDDQLCPRWLPWTQRAFIFNMMHPSSMLYLGVFDYDLGVMGHEGIGRVAINLSDFVKDTVYTLKYNLYQSSDVTERTPRGSVTIRLRLEIPDEKAFLMEGLKPRPPLYVNVKKEKSFNVIRYTCYGEHNKEGFDWTVFRSLISEILEYKSAISYGVSDSFRSLIFWRGQVKVFGQFLPLHSLTAFVTLTHVIEYPHLRLPFFFFSVAWFLMACMTSRHAHPSPWHKCKTFGHYVKILNKGQSRPEMVEPKECAEEAAAYEKAWQDRLERDWELADMRYEIQMMVDNIGQENIATSRGGGLNIDLIQRLGRYQGYVKKVCIWGRYLKLVFTWEESMISFWITAVFLGLSVVTLFLPWRFILHYTIKLLIWTFLGPWMKVVDLYFASEGKDTKELILQGFHEQSKMARLKGEEQEKLKAIKTLKFGKYITQVPAYNLVRHYDRPLPESFAYDIDHEKEVRDVHTAGRKKRTVASPKELDGFVPGQQLHGFMIPRPHQQATTNRELAAAALQGLIRLRERRLSAGNKRPVRISRRISKAVRLNVAKMLQMELKNESTMDDGDDFRDDANDDDEGFEVVASDRRQLVPYIDHDKQLSFKLRSPEIHNDDGDNTTHDVVLDPMVPMELFFHRNNQDMEFLMPAKSITSRSRRAITSESLRSNRDHAIEARDGNIISFVDGSYDDDNCGILGRGGMYSEDIDEEGVELIYANSCEKSNDDRIAAAADALVSTDDRSTTMDDTSPADDSSSDESEEAIKTSSPTPLYGDELLSNLYRFRNSERVMVAFCQRQ